MVKCVYLLYTNGTISGAGAFLRPRDFIPNFPTQYLVFCAMFRRSLFAFLSFLYWPLYCLSSPNYDL